MKKQKTAIRLLLSTISCAVCLHADIFYDTGVTALTLGNPTQLGRLSRNGIISDWSTAKAFPGVINPAVAYHYTSYTLSNLIFPYVQISVDDISGGNTFVSAYLNAYNPGSIPLNYLGDEGQSGNPHPGDPSAFQVVVPQGNSLVLVVNDTAANGGSIGQTYDLLVEGFSDTNYNEITPEPSGWALNALGLSFAGILVYSRRKKLRRASAD